MTDPSRPASPSPEPGLPRTLAEAAERLARSLAPEDRARIAALPESGAADLNGLQFGAAVRKDCGLWRGNRPLMASCGALNPEEASEAIIRALWARLRGA